MFGFRRGPWGRWFGRGGEPRGDPSPAAMSVEPGGDEASIVSELFVSYAGEDLQRWREAVGCRAWSRDARRGIGHLSDVRWASCGAGVAPHIQVCVRYEAGFSSWIRGAAFGVTHVRIGVSPELRGVLLAAAQAGDEGTRSEILGRWSARLRQEEDTRRLRRIRQLQDTVRRQDLDGESPASSEATE